MIIRERKITAKSVTKATLLASIKDEGTSLELMASLFEQDDIDITKQSLHAKINQHAVGFMKAVFDKLCELLIGNLANTISTKFKDILIVDSSEIKLNRGLAELYKSTRNGARCKLQAIYRLLSKNLQCDITKANKNDQGYKGYLDRVTQGDLVIFDLGYFALESFKTIMSKVGYVVARLLRGTTIMNINKEKIDIEKLLKTSSRDVDMMILLGEKSQLACRLIAHKLTGEALIKRQEKLRREAKKSGKKKVQQVCTEIDNWSIYITNLKQETGQEIHNLYRLRWQIELLFKALKSKLSMGEIKDKNEHKAMMMIYGKLIVTVLGLMFISFIDDEKNEISLYKAMSYCKEMIGRIYNDLRKGLVKSLEKFLLKLQKFAQKSRRKNRPSTFQICGL